MRSNSIPEHILLRKIDFEKRYVKKESGCWEWVGVTAKNGYGRFWGNFLAHRVSYALYKECPKGFFVCHKCDNPPCVNPDHLFLGTAKQNTQDMISKGRKYCPPPFSTSSVISYDVFIKLKTEYIESNISLSMLAKKYKISPAAIRECFIKNKIFIRKFVFKKINKDILYKMIYMYENENLSLRQISEKFNLDRKNITYLFRNNGVKIYKMAGRNRKKIT
jgi:predicted DNA-binding protein YlxM (UPF0122 family)